MPKIAWDVTLPADSSNASAADDQIRSDITAIATLLGQSFYWPGSGGAGASSASHGQLKPGTAYPARGNTNLGLGGGQDGTLGFPYAHRLHHIGSTWTGLVASTWMTEAVGFTVGADQHVVASFGSASVTLSGDVTDELYTNFAQPYAVAPIIIASVSTTEWIWGISTVSQGGFRSLFSYVNVANELLPETANGSKLTLYYEAYGVASWSTHT